MIHIYQINIQEEFRQLDTFGRAVYPAPEHPVYEGQIILNFRGISLEQAQKIRELVGHPLQLVKELL